MTQPTPNCACDVALHAGIKTLQEATQGLSTGVAEATDTYRAVKQVKCGRRPSWLLLDSFIQLHW